MKVEVLKVVIQLFSKMSRLVLVLTQPPIYWVAGVLSTGIKWYEFQTTCFLHHHASTLKKKAAGCSGMLLHTYQTAWCHIPEDHNLNIYHNLNYFAFKHRTHSRISQPPNRCYKEVRYYVLDKHPSVYPLSLYSHATAWPLSCGLTLIIYIIS